MTPQPYFSRIDRLQTLGLDPIDPLVAGRPGVDWAYDEAEGVFPGGESIAVEREPDTYTAVPVGDIDIWQLSLDGSGSARRLTHFTGFAGYGANNPVVRPDGSKMAFGVRIKGGEHGNAEGILVYDFDRAPR